MRSYALFLYSAALGGMLAVAQSAAAQSDNWSSYAIVSETMGVSGGRLCVGEASRGDIGCPTYAPSLTTAGDISVTGNLSAAAFIGDGSGLTGIATGAVDRLVSGTQAVVANEGSGYVSLSTAGTDWGYLGTVASYLPRLNAGGISLTTGHGISSTNGYFTGKVGIGTTAPSGTLHVTGWQQWDGGSAQVRLFPSGDSSYIGTANAYKFGIRTGSADRMTFDTAGNVGIATTTPQATLQVSGSFTVSATGQTTTPTLYVNTVSGILGIGTSSPRAKLDVVGLSAGAQANYAAYIQAGNTSGSGLVIIPGTDTGGFGGLVIVNAANSLYRHRFMGSGDAYLGLSGGSIGIGTTAPSATLHVSGTARITSWTAIAANVTPTTALDVYGTISATNFVGNGSGLTGLTSAATDRISSSTNGAMVVAEGNIISFTTSGINTAYLDASGRYIGPGISITTTHGISSTNGYFTGNVGIGTTAPASGLHQYYNNSFNSIGGLRIEQDGAGNAFMQIGLTGGKAYGLGVDNSDAGKFKISYGSSSFPQLNANTRFTIDDTGNVGINTTAPSKQLHVSGTALITSNTEVSGTIKLSGMGNEGCTSTDLGTLRLNPSTGKLQLCRQ